MKRFFTLSLVLFGLLTIAGITSCDFNAHEDPEHPLYVTYSISAGEVKFEGPEQLKMDIEAWIKNNQVAYDRQVNYSTGDASEFTTTDNEAVKKYEEEYVPKFRAHLNEVTAELNKGTYGKSIVVNATFFVYAKRSQGKNGDLRYEHIEYSYPQSSQQ